MMSPRSPIRRSLPSRSAASRHRPAPTLFASPIAPELAQPTRADRLLEGIVDRSGDDALGVHSAEQPSVDRGQPFLLDIVAEACFDFLVGARAQIERHQFGGALAKAVRDIVAGDDQILHRCHRRPAT
jgi:hypothetical protein